MALTRTPSYREPHPRPDHWLFRVVVVFLGVLAILFLATGALADAGRVPWSDLGQRAGAPWASILNARVGPRAASLVSRLGLLLGACLVARLVLRRSLVTRVFGQGVVVALWRLRLLGLVPLILAALGLAATDPSRLGMAVTLRGQSLFLTAPTLTAFGLLGAGWLLLASRPTSVGLSPRLGRLATASVVAADLGLVVAAVQSTDRALLVGPLLTPVFAQMTLLAIELSVGLALAEAMILDLRDLRARPSLLASLLGGTLLLIRVAVVAWPVGTGLWLATFATLSSASAVLDRDGRLVTYLGDSPELRHWIPASQVPASFCLALDATEDRGICTAPLAHSPVDPLRLALAVQSGGESGGSTVAAQVCKAWSGRPISGWLRAHDAGRIADAAVAAEKLAFEFPCGWVYERSSLALSPFLGRDHTPITLYANLVPFGRQIAGIEAAAQLHFGKPARDLTLAESALLVGKLQANTVYDPWLYPAAAKRRQVQVLGALQRTGQIGDGELTRLAAEPLPILAEPAPIRSAPSAFVDVLVVRWLSDRGLADAGSSGYDIRTTLDSTEQSALDADAERVVRRLAPRGVNNAAALVVRPTTGEIVAAYGGAFPLVGEGAQPDGLLSTPHQPGSALKPLTYACALRAGVLAPDGTLDDDERVIDGRRVGNFDGLSLGRRPAALELAESRNTAAAELVSRMTPEGFAACLRDVFGLRADLHPAAHGIELGIGLAPVPLVEVAQGYQVLASDGVRRELRPVSWVADRSGWTLIGEQSGPDVAVLPADDAGWVTQALLTVPARLRSRGVAAPDGLAVKTGSTAESSYAGGYGPDLSFVAWVGRTEPGRGALAVDVEGAEGAAFLWAAAAERYLGAGGEAFGRVQDAP